MICNNILEAMGNTPIIRLQHMTGPDDAEILVKFEGLNVGGSIKTRTAFNMILDAEQNKKKGKAHEYKNPVLDFINSLYWLTGKPEITDEMKEDEVACERAFEQAIANGARFGFPVKGLKDSAVSAAYRAGWTKDKVSARGAFFVKGVTTDMIEIQGIPKMREDMVRVGMGSADIRYRGEFEEWSAKFTLEYDVNGQYSLESILNMLNAGGRYCGIGEMRPEKGGQNGMFHIKATA